MMILPQFLFLFQTLPIVVPENYFKNCNRIISNCISNNKKQRITFKTLCKPKEEGGLGLPNLQGYSLATQLLTIMKWTERETETKWINIEKEMVGISIGTLPFIGRTQWRNYTGQNYCIDNTLANWKHVCKNLKMDNKCVLVRDGRGPRLYS